MLTNGLTMRSPGLIGALGGCGGPCPSTNGSWTELARTTLCVTGDLISVACLPDKRHYQVLVHGINCGTVSYGVRLNSCTGCNYARRVSFSGGADSLSVAGGDNQILVYSGGYTFPSFSINCISNYISNEKQAVGHLIGSGGSGSGVVPSRAEAVGKWVNTIDSINEIRYTNFGTGSYAVCSEVVVLGWDETDTHDTVCNFWQELGTTTLTAPGDTIEVTFTAKKYLYFQSWQDHGGTVVNPRLRMGNGSIDAGNNYSSRLSVRGEVDTTAINGNGIAFYDTTACTDQSFSYGYIVNVSDKEKLMVAHQVDHFSPGGNNVPKRGEAVGKWDIITGQTDRIAIINTNPGDFCSGSTMTVWGAN